MVYSKAAVNILNFHCIKIEPILKRNRAIGYQYPKTLFDIMSTDYTIQIYYVLLDFTNIQILFRMS